jgi:hypothetical protein
MAEGQEMDERKQSLIDEVVRREWDFFQQVNNEGGRADCQDNWGTFRVMRSSQYACWPDALIQRINRDLAAAQAEGRNPVMEKYARMMASTAPEQYRKLERQVGALAKKQWLQNHKSIPDPDSEDRS